MNQSSISLQVGLAEFAEPTLLILGSAESLRWLADRLEERRPLDLAHSPLVQLRGVGLVLKLVDVEGNIERHGPTFTWAISPTEAQQFASQLRELAASSEPAHAYLDPKTNHTGVQVMASKGEYSAEAVFSA